MASFLIGNLSSFQKLLPKSLKLLKKHQKVKNVQTSSSVHLNVSHPVHKVN